MAWLWNSMIPEISYTCMFLNLEKEIWDSVEQTYAKAKDTAQVYEVKVKNLVAKLGNKTIIEYANQLKSLWMELDHYRAIKTTCSKDSIILKDHIEKDRVHDFLVGLNSEFDQIRIQIMGKPKVPCFNEVVAIPWLLSRGKQDPLISRRKMACGVLTTISLATLKRSARSYMEDPLKTEIKNGDIKGGDPKKRGQVYVARTNEEGKYEDVCFSQEHIERVRTFYSKLEKPTSVCSLAYSDKDSGRTIGHAKEWNGLYILKNQVCPLAIKFLTLSS
ncbi:hypothetical protein SESBI_13778 [Sesbania bispinosa]|nr:hypothetical protein SESBI_13778 [Sesbania bispinosa]